MPNALTWLFLAALAAALATRLWLARRQIAHVRAHRSAVPEGFAGVMPLAAHQKAADYTVAKAQLGIVELAAGGAVLLALTLGGALAWISAPTQMPGVTAIASLVALGVVCTALALLLFFSLIHTAGAARAALVAYINPAVAALLGVLVLNEPFGWGSVLGLGLILFGSWLATGHAPAPSAATNVPERAG